MKKKTINLELKNNGMELEFKDYSFKDRLSIAYAVLFNKTLVFIADKMNYKA